VAANTSTASRSGTIQVLDGNSVVQQTLTVTQSGVAPSYVLSYTSASFTANAVSSSVGLTANASWTAQADVSWVANISPASGGGNATINYSVAANTTGISRTGRISIGNQTLTITQQPNSPPVAVASIVSSSATVPPSFSTGVAINFSGSGSSDPDGTITSYAWNFGDGSFGSGVSPSHSYTAVGTYVVTLTVTDNLGASGSDSQTLVISESSNNPGQHLWSATVGTTGNDYGYSVATDSQGNVLLTGNLNNFILIEKYSSTGTLLWSKEFYSGTGSGKAITVDRNDNVLVAGTFFNGIDFGGATRR